MVMKGIRRTIGTAPVQKQPATAERVSAMLAPFGAHHAGQARPRADPARHGRRVPSLRTGGARRVATWRSLKRGWT